VAAPPAEDGRRALLVSAAPLMQSIVPLIFVSFLIPGIAYGVAAGTVRTHRDVVAGMSKAMSGMGYYIVMAFFCAQFIYAFGQSNLGALLAIKGADTLRDMGLPIAATLVGIVLLTGLVNLLVGSASAKWALIGTIMCPCSCSWRCRPTSRRRRIAWATVRPTSSRRCCVFPADRRVLPPLRAEQRHRHADRADAALLPGAARQLDGVPAALLVARLPLGIGSSYEYLPPAAAT